MLEKEHKTKQYQTNHINQHINKFIELQTMQTTQENYKTTLKQFNQHLKDTNTKEINIYNKETIIRQYQHYLTTTNLKSTSINNYILRVQSFFNYLGLPVKIKKLNNTTTSKPYKYLTKTEINYLLETIENTNQNIELKTRNTAIIKLLFTAGLRIKELLNITLNDYITENNITYVNITGKGKYKDTKEAIAIPEDTKKAIDNYLIARKKRNSKYLFVNIRNQPLTRQGVNKMLHKEAMKTDEIYNLNINARMSSHVFRHSLARYLLINKNVPISQVKDILRHANIETTSKYLTNSQDELTNIRINLI